MEAMCEELERDAQGAKEREEAARKALKESTESARKKWKRPIISIDNYKMTTSSS